MHWPRNAVRAAWKDRTPAARLNIVAAPFLLVTGAVLQKAIDIGLKGLDIRWTIVGLLALAMVLVAVVAIAVFDSQEQAVRDKAEEANAVFDKIDGLARRLGVTAEIVPEDENGATYVRSTELIKDASESLLFVDIWAPPDGRPYQEPGSRRDAARRAYYETIVEWLEGRLKKYGGPCYRRIIQLDDSATEETLRSNATTWQHISDCIKLGNGRPGTTAIQRARKRFWSNIAIIDDRHVVHTLLLVRDDGAPERHAAIIYRDLPEEIVRMYREVVERLEPSPMGGLRVESAQGA